MNFKIRKKINKKHFKYFHLLKQTGLGSDTFINHNDETSILLHSGSTTGDPKTICLSNNAFNHISSHYEEFASEPLEKMKNTGMLCVLPSFHGFGLCIPMHTALTHQFASVLIPKFTIENVLDALKHTNTTSLCGVPTMYEKLINDSKFVSSKHIQKIKVAYCGGDNMSPSLKERFDQVMENAHSSCKLLEGYGLTEAICVNCVNTYDNNKLGSIGKPMSGASFKIFDDNFNELKPNEIGEIAIKSQALMNGYYNDEKATKEAFHDGYLLTGDLGYIDEDGYVFFKQRKKRIIKASGVAIFPSEIEMVIKKMDGVKDAVVISIPDEKLIHAAKAFVVLDNKEIKQEDIKDFCKKYLIRWAVPKQIEFVDEIKYTLLGKADYKYFQNMEDERR